MKPNTEHVKPLEEFDADAFADLLRRGFEIYISNPGSLLPFTIKLFVNRLGI